MLNSHTLRQIWLIIEQTHTRLLLELSDSQLVAQIQQQLEAEIFIPENELNAARNYLQSRIPLIRDTAQGRLAFSIDSCF